MVNRLKRLWTRIAGTELERENRRIFRNAKTAVRSVLRALRKKRHRVMILCYSFYGGGAEKVACWLGETLAEDKDTGVLLLCAEKKEKTYLTDNAIPQIVLPVFMGPKETVREQRTRFVAWLKKAARANAAVSFMFFMNQINAASRGKTRVICSERNNPARREPEHMEEIEEIYGKADHVVFQTESVRGLFSDAVREHSTVIPNPVRAMGERRAPRRRIVTVGRLNPQKNQALLLRAFSRFHEDHPEYTLSIYGEGDLLEELQELARTLGIENAVIFEGNVKDVHSQITDGEMFVLSSDFEGMSNALLECMAMGFPCISTACDGSVELIRSGENGILTKIGDEEELYEAMTLLADNEELREQLGRNAARTVRANHPEIIAGQWKQMLRDVEKQ